METAEFLLCLSRFCQVGRPHLRAPSGHLYNGLKQPGLQVPSEDWQGLARCRLTLPCGYCGYIGMATSRRVPGDRTAPEQGLQPPTTRLFTSLSLNPKGCRTQLALAGLPPTTPLLTVGRPNR